MNSGANGKNKSVFVVACDAGGAEVIGAYVKKNRHRARFHSYVAGPAVRIFKKLGLPFQIIGDSKKEIASVVLNHAGSKYALIGLPGLLTDIERTALQESKKAGLKTVVYFDSWALYKESFGYPKRGWQKSLPEEMWAGDRYALSIIKRDFKRSARFVPNQYLANIRIQYRNKSRYQRKPNRILFLSSVQKKTEKVLSFLLSFLSDGENFPVLRIRFHPADDRSRYDELIKKYRKIIKVEKSNSDLVNDLLCAKVVIGMETAALVASVQCGIKTISLLPKGERRVLPFRGIVHKRFPVSRSKFSRLLSLSV